MIAKAITAQVITQEQAEALMAFCKTLPEQSPAFNLTNVLYYFGGLTAICAMTLFMNLGWELYGAKAILLLSISYGALGLALAHQLQHKGYDIPAGICATFTICLTPLAIYALQKIFGWWPSDSITYQQYHYFIRWNWLYMELGTLVVGTILAWIYRYPFMIMPIAITLWYMSMDVACMITDRYDVFSTMITLYFGLITTLIAFWVDVRSRHSKDYAFWLYIFGVIAFWSGLSAQSSDGELAKFFYLCINLLMMTCGVILNRKVFLVFGALGCYYYLGHLAYQVFNFSYVFPIILTIVGLFIIYLGILWQRHEVYLTRIMRSILSPQLRELFESRDEKS